MASLVEDDFVWIGRKLIELAQKGWNGRNVSVQEGGYDSAKPCLLRQRAFRNADGGLRTQSARFLCRRHSGVSRLEKSSWHHDEFRRRNRTLLTTQKTSRYWRRGVVAVFHHPCASPCARHEDRAQDDAYGGCRQPTTQPPRPHTTGSPEGACRSRSMLQIAFRLM